MTDTNGSGPLREEMRRLSEALAGLQSDDDYVGSGPSTRQQDADPHADRPAAEGGGHLKGCRTCGCGAPGVCAACPVCRAASLVASLRPDALARLADLAGVAAEVLRAAAEGAARTQSSGEAARPPVEEIPVIRNGNTAAHNRSEQGATP